jgi:hypothetical protein|tara:strand:+ start:11913 stop:12365 length:453 start_codon:yes stop_codon:yes gene_type:complete
MANDAIASIQATVLPDEIAKTLSATMTVSPSDANDKWYFKKTSVSNSSTDLIAGNYTDYTAVDDDTAPTAVATGDKVNFLFIKNIDTNSRSIYIVLDAGTASSSVGDGITIGPNEFFCARLPNTTVADIHAISSASTAEVLVCALLDDVG